MDLDRPSWRHPNQLLRLIHEFKIRPNLWDSTQENYLKNKKQRQIGISEIAALFETNDHDIERRWRSLRTIYRRELKKMEDERKKGRQVRVKWFPFSYMDEFLHRVCVKEEEKGGTTFLDDLLNVAIEVNTSILNKYVPTHFCVPLAIQS